VADTAGTGKEPTVADKREILLSELREVRLFRKQPNGHVLVALHGKNGEEVVDAAMRAFDRIFAALAEQPHAPTPDVEVALEREFDTLHELLFHDAVMSPIDTQRVLDRIEYIIAAQSTRLAEAEAVVEAAETVSRQWWGSGAVNANDGDRLREALEAYAAAQAAREKS
jgi:hypothetical protein